MTIEEKLQHLRTSALEDARAQSDQIISEYQNSLNALFEEYKQEKLAQADITVKAETANVEHNINKALANEHLAIKTKLSRRQHEHKKQLFEEIHGMLDEFRKTADYKSLLLSQIRKAENFAKNNDFCVYIDPSDKHLLAQLQEETGADIRISEESFIGGTRTVIPSRHILMEESFENKLKEAYESFTFHGGKKHE